MQSKSKKNNEFLVADFASGEHDRVPSFFIKEIPEFMKGIEINNQTTVYSIDLHALRLDSLLGTLEESSLLERTRVIHANLASMNKMAEFRPDMKKFLDQNEDVLTSLDSFLLMKKRIPPECFDIGILNNDVVGYLHEYYKDYGDAIDALRSIYETIRKGALLIVTQPCMVNIVDNVAVLESIGFKFMEGLDVNLADRSISYVRKNAKPQNLIRLNHYVFMVFSKVDSSRIES
ncbi:MAG: hypothetical protein ACFFCP_04325 [Promethearchaeota archaeon]